jgi:hypothetical protein
MLEPLPREEQGMMIALENLRQHGHARHHRHLLGVTDIIPPDGDGVIPVPVEANYDLWYNPDR